VLIVESGLGHGGSAICLANALTRLDRGSFDPMVAFYSDGRELHGVERLGVPVVRVRPRDSRRMGVLERPAEERGRLRSQALMGRHLLAEVLPHVPTFARLFRSQRVDLVHLNSGIIGTLAALLGARLTGVPVLCHHRLSRTLQRLERLAARWVDFFVPVSLAALEGLRASGIPGGRMHVIYDGLEPDRFAAARGARDGTRRGLDVPPRACLVGTVARLARVKGQLELLRAAPAVLREAPEAHFVLVGDAAPEERAYEAELHRFVADRGLGGRVTFAGYRADVPEVTAALDVAVQPSLYCEGQGMAAVEAMMLGVPLVVTESGALPETVGRDGGGFIVPPGDPGAMAAAIVCLLRDPARAAAMGEAARLRAHQVFSLEATVAELEKVYARVLERRRTRPKPRGVRR
jgi:glycosyltransferase involved in cell wall biosynthesis